MSHFRTGLVAVLLLAGSGAAEAQYFNPDRLECFRLRVTKGRWFTSEHAREPFTLQPVSPELGLDRGCRLVPAKNPVPKELCVPADKAPRHPPSGSASYQALLCYDARCEPGLVDAAPQIAGEFGGGQPLVKRRDRKRRVCVPAVDCHDPCVTGEALAPACGTCAARVCETDPYCCEYGWFSSCVARAAELCGSCPGVPTPSPSPVWTPTPTPSPSPEPGAACSQATATISLQFDPILFDDVAGAVVAVRYPAARLLIPGTGGDPPVLARVGNLTGVQGGLFSAGDSDFEPTEIRVGLISLAQAIPPGPFASITFDCVGPDGPVAADLSCVPEVSTFVGNAVPATCSIALATTPPTGSAAAAFLERPTDLLE